MSRPRPGLRSALPPLIAAAAGCALLASSLLGCAGSSDPTSAIQVGATGTYVNATVTLLDTASPCLPGVACAPEFYDCDGVEGFTIPRTWTIDATEASAGGVSIYNIVGGLGNISIAVRGTDVQSETGVSVELRLAVDPVARTWTTDVGPTVATTFVNLDTRCTRINAGLDPVTLFGYVNTGTQSATVTALPLRADGHMDFATDSGAGLSADFIEGTFSFIAENRQEFGQVYIGRVRVEGCFRVQVPLVEQGVGLDPAAAGGC